VHTLAVSSGHALDEGARASRFGDPSIQRLLRLRDRARAQLRTQVGTLVAKQKGQKKPQEDAHPESKRKRKGKGPSLLSLALVFAPLGLHYEGLVVYCDEIERRLVKSLAKDGLDVQVFPDNAVVPFADLLTSIVDRCV